MACEILKIAGYSIDDTGKYGKIYLENPLTHSLFKKQVAMISFFCRYRFGNDALTIDHDTLEIFCSYDGDYFVANGQIMIVTGKNTYELYTMQPGYVFRSYFVPTATGGSMYYEWDGTKIIERVM